LTDQPDNAPLVDPITQHVAEALAKANGEDPQRVVVRDGDPFPRKLWEFFYKPAMMHRAAYDAMRETEKDRVH
jgi:hypothetical protein